MVSPMITRVSLPDTEAKLLTGSIPGVKLRDDGRAMETGSLDFVTLPLMGFVCNHANVVGTVNR